MRLSGPAIFGLILIVLGVLILLDNLDVAEIRYVIRTYWPLILVIVGLSLLLRGRHFARKKMSENTKSSYTSSGLDHTNVFGDVKLDMSSQSFKGGNVSTIFGDVDLDLTKASLTDGEHSLRISTVFGDVKVDLPKGLAFSVSGATLFGELQIAGQSKSGIAKQVYHASEDYDRSRKKLRIDCSQVFGDLCIA